MLLLTATDGGKKSPVGWLDPRLDSIAIAPLPASAWLILNLRLALPSWAMCQADGFCRVAVEDALDLFDHGLHNFMAAGGDPIDGVGG